MASKLIQQTTRRRCQIHIQQRLFSDSSKVTDFTSKKSTGGSSTADRSQGVVAEPTSMLSRITSLATQTTQRSLEKAKEIARTNLKNTKQSLKDSITSAAQSRESSHYVSRARSSINNLGQKVKTSAVDNLNNTKNILKDSISSAADKSKERIKREISSRLSFKSLPNSNTAAKKSNEATQQSISKSGSVANFATRVLSETTAQAASNMTSTVKEGASKATRWLWWWGLAAVGVYGMSTTLTKEGVQLLKDLVGGGAKSSNEAGAVVGAAGNRGLTPVQMEAVDGSCNETTAVPTWFSSLKNNIWGSRKRDG